MISIVSLFAQIKTIEFTPEFHKSHGENTTNVIPFDGEDRDLEFITLSCYHFDKLDLPVFFRLLRSGTWSNWIQMDQQHEFVESSRTAYRAKPIMKTFTAIQFKSTEDLVLTVRFFLADKASISMPIVTAPILNRSLSCDLPTVCERDCWCPTCPIDSTPQLTEPTHLIVHHSAGNNESENFAMVVESIWDIHVNTNGWDDIGYNWLVDPNGVLYQGRLDNYQGAHFSCINENTVGVCVIGDYSNVAPSEAALSTLTNVLAFEATDHGIDVLAESYHLTGDFVLANVAGHRDSNGSINACSGTECPGESFYFLLPDLRFGISELPCYIDVISATEAELELKISVYPNPFKDQLFIELGDLNIGKLELLNVQGKSFGFVQVDEVNDLSGLAPGVYFLLREGVEVARVIKE